MPSYNSSKTIKRAIDSVLSQSYKNWELIITDDHSSDDPIKTIKTYNNFKLL